MGAILVIAYMAAGYWAVGQTIWRNKTIIEFKPGAAFTQRMIWGSVLGWVLIPVAIIGKLAGR